MNCTGQLIRLNNLNRRFVGVTHENSDGTDRQKVIQKCGLFENLALEHQDDNPHDSNAVRVCRKNGQQLGKLNSVLAGEIVEESERGYHFRSDTRSSTAKA
jgi:HIRAN domain